MAYKVEHWPFPEVIPLKYLVDNKRTCFINLPVLAGTAVSGIHRDDFSWVPGIPHYLYSLRAMKKNLLLLVILIFTCAAILMNVDTGKTPAPKTAPLHSVQTRVPLYAIGIVILVLGFGYTCSVLYRSVKKKKRAEMR